MSKSYRGKNAVGNYLKNRRIQAGLTQSEVSKKLGYSSPQYISNFERGLCSPPLKQLKKIVDLYKIASDELIEIIIEDQKRMLDNNLKSKKKNA